MKQANDGNPYGSVTVESDIHDESESSRYKKAREFALENYSRDKLIALFHGEEEL